VGYRIERVDRNSPRTAAYTSALVGLRTVELSPLVQPGQELFPLMGLSGTVLLNGRRNAARQRGPAAGVGVSGDSVAQDVGILESALRESYTPALAATS
jgi:uncharacterized protein GlcG (DUF336 family)